MLPEKLSIGLVEANQYTQIDVTRITLQIAIAIVRPDNQLARRHDRIAVGLAAQCCHPLDVLGSLWLPRTRLAIEFAGRPIGDDAFGDRRVIAERSAAPLRPVARLDRRVVKRRVGLALR